MKVLFAGTPDYARRSLLALLGSRHTVFAVLTQPDRRAGRGLETAESPVKKLARERGIRVLQPLSLRDPPLQQEIEGLGPDVIATAAYGLIFPQSLLDIPPLGCINVHASLLPRWRGAAPVQRALLAGDASTGVAIMRMDAGLDTGPVYLQESVPITPNDTAGTLTERLAERGGQLLVRVLDALDGEGGIEAAPQPTAGATYAPKIEKAEARLDWRQDAASVDRRVRAFNPAPGATARLRGTDLKVWSCAPSEGTGSPGEVLRIDPLGVDVACGEGALRVTELQRPGGKRLKAGDFLRGFPLSVGERFDT